MKAAEEQPQEAAEAEAAEEATAEAAPEMEAAAAPVQAPLPLKNRLSANVVNLKVNDIDNVDSYAIIVTFMSALKPAQNMR